SSDLRLVEADEVAAGILDPGVAGHPNGLARRPDRVGSVIESSLVAAVEIIDEKAEIGMEALLGPERHEKPARRSPLAECSIEVRRFILMLLFDEFDVEQPFVERARELEVADGDVDEHEPAR